MITEAGGQAIPIEADLLHAAQGIAMIERGLVPPPEVDPRGFDRVMHRLERHEVHSGAGRHRRAGVTLMGVG